MIYALLFILGALAVYRLCRLTIEDTITEPIREKVWSKFPPETSKIGYWFTCYWCTSILFAVLMVGLYLAIPVVAIIFAAILALSAVVGIIDHLMTR